MLQIISKFLIAIILFSCAHYCSATDNTVSDLSFSYWKKKNVSYADTFGVVYLKEPEKVDTFICESEGLLSQRTVKIPYKLEVEGVDLYYAVTTDKLKSCGSLDPNLYFRYSVKNKGNCLKQDLVGVYNFLVNELNVNNAFHHYGSELIEHHYHFKEKDIAGISCGFSSDSISYEADIDSLESDIIYSVIIKKNAEGFGMVSVVSGVK